MKRRKNEKDAHPPIGRVSQKGRVGARPARSEVLLSMRLSSRSGSKYGAVIVAPDGTQEAEPTQYQPHQTYSQSFIQRSKVFS